MQVAIAIAIAIYSGNALQHIESTYMRITPLHVVVHAKLIIISGLCNSKL